MTGFGLDGRILVRTARCRTRRRDGARVRDALERLDPETGLPRSAILVVRRLQATLVGNPPRLDGVGLRSVASTAHRATSAPPPADCEAVLFADEAELLTSLCRDVAHHRPLGWWWRALLGSTIVTGPQDFTAAATVGLSRFPRALPAAAARAPHAVVAAASLLPDVDLLRVTGAMADAHGARPTADVLRDAWQRAVASGSAAAGDSRGPEADGSGAVPRADAARSGTPRAPAERMARLLGGPAVSPLVAVLVDIALRLHRDPVGARSTAAADATAARLRSGAPIDDGPPTDAGVVAPTAPTTETEVVLGGESQTRPSDTPVSAGSSPDAAADQANADARSGDASPGRDDAAASDASPAGEDEADAPDAAEDSDDLDLVETGLGGAFYLLNLLESLDLPDSADGPDEPGELLTRWGVLALVLRCWPGVDPDDPLFTVLDGLAWPEEPGPFDVRPTGGDAAHSPEVGSPPFRTDEPDRSVYWISPHGGRSSTQNESGWAYRRPRGAGFDRGDSALRWWREDSSGRIVVVDAALADDPATAGAAVVADVPAADDADGDLAIVAAELQRLGREDGRGNSPPVSVPEATAHRDGAPSPPEPKAVGHCLGLGSVDGPQRWATRVAQLLQGMLAQRGLGPDVVRMPARVEETGFSVRVHMALDDADLDVRRVGLDRDPGWVPALGRVVELVYA